MGRRRTVTLGALLMTAGHFCMAFDQSFLLAMLFLILGAGALRGNLQPQVGELYAFDDRRRVVAFQLYASMVNLGAFIAPLVTGALGKAYGWHVAFASRRRRHARRTGRLPDWPAPPDRDRAARRRRTASGVDAQGVADHLAAAGPVPGRIAVLDRAEPSLEHLQSLGPRPHPAARRRFHHAGGLAAVAGRPRPVHLPAADAGVLAVAGGARARAQPLRQDRHRLLHLRRLDALAGGRRPGHRWRRPHAAAVGRRLPPGLQPGLALFHADCHGDGLAGSPALGQRHP